MDIQDFKDKLVENLVSQFAWLDTHSMVADSLTKESKYNEDLKDITLENTFKFSMSEFNKVAFKEGEIKMENQTNKKAFEEKKLEDNEVNFHASHETKSGGNIRSLVLSNK